VILLNKVGYISKIKSKGKEYFYLRKSIRKLELVEKKTIYSFGTRESAMKKLLSWSENTFLFPPELRELGYGSEDVLNWIEQIKNK
jgi:hypothetical protein